jgi:hypothetical protein
MADMRAYAAQHDIVGVSIQYRLGPLGKQPIMQSICFVSELHNRRVLVDDGQWGAWQHGLPGPGPWFAVGARQHPPVWRRP